jgi:type II secretory pathway pseudopilin PulG
MSLAEQLIALAVTGLVFLGVLSLWQQTQQAYLEGAEAADVQQNLRVALDALTRAIQAAGANPTNQAYAGAVANDPAFVAFREAGPLCVRLYSDLDGNGDVRGAENIKLTVNDGPSALLRQEVGGGPDVGQPWVSPSLGLQELASNLVPNPGGVPVFQFFTGPNDADPNTLLPQPPGSCAMGDADRQRIARVVVTLTAQGSVGSQPFTRTWVSEARPRNVP